MARKILIVCDTCSSEEGVQTFEVRHDGEKGKADLCQKHGAPLLAVIRSAAGATSEPQQDPAAAERAAKRKEARERRAAEQAAASA